MYVHTQMKYIVYSTPIQDLIPTLAIIISNTTAKVGTKSYRCVREYVSHMGVAM